MKGEGRLRVGLTAAIAVFACCFGASAAQLEPIRLWPDDTRRLPGPATEETVRTTAQGEHIVSNVHDPSITPFLPDTAKANGTAVIVIPGGGHRELWMDHEGYRVAQWLSERGVAAFVLKYRLARQEGSTYTVEGDELADVRRAIRLVRSRAALWNIAPDRVGVIGFSAGGELAALAGTRFDSGAATAADPLGRIGARPDFMALIYPAIPRGLALPARVPPAFLLAGAEDSPEISQGVAELYLRLKWAGAPAELHVIAGAGHGFGLRPDNPPSVAVWPSLFLDWLQAVETPKAR